MLVERVKKFGKKIIICNGNRIVSLSLLLATIISIGSCRFILHQPKEPKELERYITK